MKATITGNDGKVRCVRAVRCATAAIWKKDRKTIAIGWPGADNTSYIALNRRIRNITLQAKNSPARYARRVARHAAARAAVGKPS